MQYRVDQAGSVVKTIGQGLTEKISDYYLRKELMNMGQLRSWERKWRTEVVTSFFMYEL